MNRIARLTKHLDPAGKGLEVAPFFNPTFAKRDGYDILSLDIHDAERLRARIAADPATDDARAAEIEEVDFAGDAGQIGELLAEAGLEGGLDYIVSSHNFEHLSNPVRFLRGAASALKPGGVLAMAVPDCRASFDHFRAPSRLADWLEAYHEDRDRPSPETIFDAVNCKARYMEHGEAKPGLHLDVDGPSRFVVKGDLEEAYAEYPARRGSAQDYKDVHCSLFYPESLELMLNDLRQLGLIDLEVIEVSPTIGLEFMVHLRKGTAGPDPDYAARRDRLLRRAALAGGGAPYSVGYRLGALTDGARAKAAAVRLAERATFALFGPARAARIKAAAIKKLRGRR